MTGGTSDTGAPDAIDQATQHRYRVFKKNSPYLYDYLCTNSLLWPSLSVQFFPDLEVPDANAPGATVPPPAAPKLQLSTQLAHQRLLLGTFTLGQAVDAIHLYQVPYYRNLNRCINTDHWAYNSEKEEFELPTVSKTKPRVLQLINHHGDVNRLRYMPQNPDVLASANNVGDLSVYNRTKHATIRKLGEELRINEPQLRLVNSSGARATDIFALDWNRQAQSVVVSASMDGQINVFDVQGNYAARSSANVIHETWTAQHAAAINDIEWAAKHDAVFLAADDAGALSVFDTRAPGTPLQTLAGSVPKNSVSINPSSDFCVASGDSQGQIEVWDLRALLQSARVLPAHLDAITQVKWHPRFPAILGSSSADRLVKIFDMSEPADALLFSHEGHMLGVNDFDWSLHEDWMVASVADDNSLHLWKPAHHVFKKLYAEGLPGI
ncbi:WD40 repeat-like protein [Metschnikowia bicuspidata var. bicuspidata NRRL YB-4993]|uniref:WD40 repeat-like protein n=1 Tax=Metschnikowia bicuspidata var. bicuspidata NRRL YB-4993 TaxID=869754 RepID=A0A1A0HBW7_9ASCO|nr:WD40 repeat-like protein [Metschnikowia bicuspidata var. bicuspidata NRRL YB-4993]OBA21383.1 WD40 repeat-like protein [Metschnikowia bicuspidata var. bicuspidata NRRL YB-4993]